MSVGYIYCFSNPSMPGIHKIGMTERTPDTRLSEANASDTWRPPTLYKIELAKKVLEPKQKEITLHKLFSQYTERINPKREFFRISLEEVKTFFDLIDGENWIQNQEHECEEDIEEIEECDETYQTKQLQIVKGCRDASKCFTNNQRIRHTIGINKIWIGVYDSLSNGILYNEKLYQGRSPLNKFVTSHYESERSDRVTNANAWSECECEVDGKWISTYNL